MKLSYAQAPLPVRDDILAAHQRFWDRLASPGAWWSARERVAIAAESRNAMSCRFCAERKTALSPYVLEGSHDCGDQLSSAAVDTVHRIVTDASRLTRRWFDSVVPAELSAEQYVELAGTVVAMVSTDSFCKALGFPLHPLPEPKPGECSGYRPSSAAMDEAWVPLVPLDNSATPESDLWAAGKTGYVIRALSLVPDEVRTLNDLSAVHYIPSGRVRDPAYAPGALTRSQTELIAGRVSMQNGCYY